MSFNRCKGPNETIGPFVTLPRRCQRAFSLVEIMIVIVIIGMLASIVTINVRGYMIKAKQNAAKQEIATIVQGLETFYAEYDRYPSNEEGLEVLTKATEKSTEPILKGVPKDPWGHPYQYVCPGANAPFEVVSLGADGREGGEGGDKDIASYELQNKTQ